MRADTHIAAFLRKLLLALLPVVIPLLLLGFSAIFIADEYISREIATMTSRQLDTLKDMVDITMFELDALNLTFSVNAKMISTLDRLLSGQTFGMEEVNYSKTLNDILSAQSNARPYVDSIYLYLDRYPQRILSVKDGIMELNSFPDRGWMNTAASFPAERLLWTETRELRRYSFEHSELPVFTVYRRLYPGSHGRTGTIVMNIEKSHFDGLISRAAQFDGQEVYILDGDGRLILANGDRTTMSPLCAQVWENERSPMVKERLEGSRYYVYASSTSRYGWRIVSIIPAKALEGFSVTLKKLLTAVLAFALLLGSLIALSLMRRDARRARAVAGLQQSERQARAQVLELKALRAQMNPHFLFNTLGSLYWMVFGTAGRPSPASTMIKNLSDLLKYSLEEAEEVSLADEVDAAKRYLAIQGFRYAGKFDLEWKLEEGSLDRRVVKFFLQPLLENAIIHGLKEKEKPGTIEIGARTEHDRLLVWVSDDGIGMSVEKLGEIRASLVEENPRGGSHIGLHNTHRHIVLVFGPEYGLSLRSVPGDGTRVEARFPLHARETADR